jgi:protein-tyrosine phosphatase
LWIGSRADAGNLNAVLAAGIAAIVDLAGNEPLIALPRDLTYCRFPLADGGGNEEWLVCAAVETTAAFLRGQVPVLVSCSAGMSRSPVIAAAALALVERRAPHDCLSLVARICACDVSPRLWEQVSTVIRPS